MKSVPEELLHICVSRNRIISSDNMDADNEPTYKQMNREMHTHTQQNISILISGFPLRNIQVPSYKVFTSLVILILNIFIDAIAQNILIYFHSTNCQHIKLQAIFVYKLCIGLLCSSNSFVRIVFSRAIDFSTHKIFICVQK